MLSQVNSTIQKYSMLQPGDRVVLGFSGGADSSCLLHVLLALREAYGLSVLAVHVNHCLRGDAADADEKFAATVCRDLKIPLEVYRVDVKTLAAKEGLSVEAAGRLARYESFEHARKAYGAHKIALAHHQDDNAETILMHLLRGAGLRGLSGIPPVRDSVIRPLIHTSRKAIESYCQEHHVLYCTDETNFSASYLRNKIRLQLMETLKTDYNPSIVETITKTGLLLGEEDAYLDALAAEYYERAAAAPGLLSIEELQRHQNAMKRRILRKACSQYDPALTDLSYEHCMKMLALLEGPTGKTLCLPGGLHMEKQYEHLAFFLVKERAVQSQDFCYVLPWNKFVFIREMNSYITLSQEKMICPKKLVNCCTKKFSYDKIKNAIQIRNRRPGDKITIYSMGGHKKIKDYFIDKKVPRTQRDRIPLVADGSEILWIMDEKSIVSDLYKPEKNKTDALAIYIQIWEDER